jgi:MFS family permease
LVSLAHLWRTEPVLRRAAYAQAGLFACFSVFWTCLALDLPGPAFHLGADVAGMFGIIGVVGVVAAPLAGRLADRIGPQMIITAGTALSFLAWMIFGLWGTLAGLVIGVIVLDFGMQSALISHQHIVYALRPDARSRLNTLFMTGMFLGGAAGSTGAMAAWTWGGWTLVSVFGVMLTIAVFLVRIAGWRKAVSSI